MSSYSTPRSPPGVLLEIDFPRRAGHLNLSTMSEPWAPEYRLQLVEVERILSDNTGLDVKDVVVLDEGLLEDLYAEPD
jgi:hypothetical protein